MKRNAIVCLIRGRKDVSGYDDLIERNRSLERHYKPFGKCDNLIFHEGDVTHEHQEYIAGATGNCRFVPLPQDCFSRDIADGFLPYETNWRLGYKHMCRFFAVQIFPLLQSYDYYWRLDDDCVLHGELPFDPFEELARENRVYGFVRKKKDGHLLTSETLPNVARQYLKEFMPHKVTSVDVSVTNYYNNFHVSKVAFWLRSEVKAFLRYIDDAGGIYKYRWGDSTIQAIALRMFSSPEERYRYSGIRYEHKSHNWRSFQD